MREVFVNFKVSHFDQSIVKSFVVTLILVNPPKSGLKNVTFRKDLAAP
jgi:hypothetical protein